MLTPLAFIMQWMNFLRQSPQRETKFPQPLTNRKSPPRGGGFLKSWLCKRGVPYDYLSGERFAFTKHLSAEKLFNPLFSKKMQITIPFLPPNLKELLGLTLSYVKNGWPLNCLFPTKDKISAVSQDFWKCTRLFWTLELVMYEQKCSLSR